MKKGTIKIPIYEVDLIVHQTSDWQSIFKKYGIQSENKYDAVVFEYKDKIILVLDSIKPHVIAHEIVHIVNTVFNMCNICLDTSNDESQAYLTGFLFKKIYKLIKKWGKI